MRNVFFPGICLTLLMLVVGACTRDPKPQLVIYGKDVCEHCHMVISEPRFGAQIVTPKGKVFFFDSVNCLQGFLQIKPHKDAQIYFVNSLHKEQWLASEEAHFVAVPNIRSPMGAGIFSVRTPSDLAKVSGFEKTDFSVNLQGIMKWNQLSAELSAGKFK